MIENIKEIYKRKLSNLDSKDHFCLYIDIPFCRSRCEYCIYNSLQLGNYKEEREKYAAAVIEQLSEYKELFEIKTPDSIYFGGGTPSLWTISELNQIIDNIPGFDMIKSKKMESHPSDMTEDRIRFYAEKMKLDVVSLGVQSFDKNSCQGQKRIWVGEKKIKDIVQKLHQYGIYVNIDLVALFNGDEEKDWQVFDNDMDIACNFVMPDVITSIPNYKTSLVYIEQIPRFRTILKKYVGDKYFPISEKMLSMNPDAIRAYGENDHWLATKEYWYYQETNFRYSSSSPTSSVPKNQVTLAIGGAGEHRVYGYVSDNFIVYSSFDFNKNKFEYEIVNK